MSKFTPGPWKAEQTLGEWCITGQDRDDDPYSGTVVFSDAGVNGEANARLIAAAPLLYRELEVAAKWIEDLPERISTMLDDPSTPTARELLPQLRAALAAVQEGQP